jgi:hypothetical protein
MDRVAADTVDKPVKHMEDGDAVVAIGVEDVVHLPKQCRKIKTNIIYCSNSDNWANCDSLSKR